MEKLTSTSWQSFFRSKKHCSQRDNGKIEKEALQPFSAAGRHCLDSCQILASTDKDPGIVLEVEAYRIIHTQEDISEITWVIKHSPIARNLCKRVLFLRKSMEVCVMGVGVQMKG